MDYYYVSLVLQILLFLYFEVTTLVPLFPWNDLSKYSRKEKFTEAIANGLIILLCIGLFATKIKWLMAISVMFYLVFLVMQILTWWMPYLTGIHLKQFPVPIRVPFQKYNQMAAACERPYHSRRPA